MPLPFFSCVRPLYPTPLIIDHAKDCFVFDENGNRYLDAYAGVASISVGHCRPEVVSRVKEQIDKVNHVSMLYQTRPILDYMDALQKELPDNLNRFFFVNSGSEAVDFACQSVRGFSKKPLLIAFSEGFHGGSFQAKSVTGLEAWQPVFGRDPDVVFFPSSACRSCPESGWNAKTKMISPLELHCDARCLDDLIEMMRKRREEIGGFIIEPILGVGGIITPPAGFFSRLSSECRVLRIPMVCDEVQSGFGRCGKTLFAFQRYDLHPDLVCIAKGIANGFPIGLIVGTKEISEAMSKKFHFSTFGGNPASCAAAIATLRVIEQENLQDNAENVGEWMLRRLDELFLKVPECLEIRGLGLMIGVEFSNPELAIKAVNECFHRGLLIGIGGRNRNVIRLEPPLTFTREMAEQCCRTLFESVKFALKI